MTAELCIGTIMLDASQLQCLHCIFGSSSLDFECVGLVCKWGTEWQKHCGIDVLPNLVHMTARFVMENLLRSCAPWENGSNPINLSVRARIYFGIALITFEHIHCDNTPWLSSWLWLSCTHVLSSLHISPHANCVCRCLLHSLSAVSGNVRHSFVPPGDFSWPVHQSGRGQCLESHLPIIRRYSYYILWWYYMTFANLFCSQRPDNVRHVCLTQALDKHLA